MGNFIFLVFIFKFARIANELLLNSADSIDIFDSPFNLVQSMEIEEIATPDAIVLP